MAVSSLAVIGILIFAYFLVRLYQQRSKFKDLPGPPHHPLWGHLPIMADVARNVPLDAGTQYYADYIRTKYNLGDFFYLDLWPLALPQVVIVHPQLAAQIAQSRTTFDKGPLVRQYLTPLLGAKAMVSANGHDWKIARKLFTPGMLHTNLLDHVSDCVEDCQIFCQKLVEHAAKSDVFALEGLCAKLSFNIVTRIILGVDCDAIQHDSDFMLLFRRQALLLPFTFWACYAIPPGLMTFYHQWTNRRGLDDFISNIITQRLESPEYFKEAECTSKRRFAVDYAIDACKEDSVEHGTSKIPELDPEAFSNIVSQVKTLIFAGHDTSGSTICYVFYLLNRNPTALAKLRQEHDTVFGSTLQTAQKLKEDPKILNQLPYTLAVIKEALRLLPPIVGTYRVGRKDFSLVHEGKEWPTDGFACFINNHSMMRRGDLFKDPLSFIPERHLVTDPSDPYFVPKDAWRAFEKGSRNCIGEALALIQIKVALVLTIRTFNFQEVYPEDAPALDGEKMYQAFHVTGKPSLGMPGRISFAQWPGEVRDTDAGAYV